MGSCMWHGEFRHPRLVEVYDAQFAWSREDDFFLGFVNETQAARVADLGCGTGRLTLGAGGGGPLDVGGAGRSSGRHRHAQISRAVPLADGWMLAISILRTFSGTLTLSARCPGRRIASVH
jgi:hypothetical protein